MVTSTGRSPNSSAGTYQSTPFQFWQAETLVKPSGSPEPKNWKGPYLSNMTELPKDQWGNEYQYLCPGSKHVSGFDLFSWGPDGQAGTEDDIDTSTKP